MSSMSSASKHSSGISRGTGYPRECELCVPAVSFYDPSDFGRHLRQVHSKREGGSFVCSYGPNNLCQKLPLEGVSDFDYEAHIRKFHSGPPAPAHPYSVQDEKEQMFTISSFTQNLSSVLSDPNRPRTEVHSFFTRHWGDTFVPVQEIPKCSHLPSVDMNMFLKYMKRTGQTYKECTQARIALRKVSGRDCLTDTDDLPVVLLSPTFSLTDNCSFLSIFSVPSLGVPDPLSITTRTPKPDPDARDETCEGKRSGEFRDYEALQSRLESLHDVVDSRLADKLVAKKDAFWKIVNSYGGLHEELRDALTRIKQVRDSLNRVSVLICDRTNKIVDLYEKRMRKEKLLARLHDISCLRAAQSTVQMLLSQGEYPRALECIDTGRDVLRGELSGVVSFRHLDSQLSELRDVIGRMMREDFAQLIQKEFGARPDEKGQIVLEGELCSVIVGLLRLRRFTFTVVLRNEIEESVKTILRQSVKQRVVSSGIDLAQFDPSLQNLGVSVRRLKFPEWLLVLEDVMSALFAFILRIESLQEMVLELCDRVCGREESVEPTDEQISSSKPAVVGNNSSSSDADDLGSSLDSALFASAGSQVVDAVSMLAVEVRSPSQLRHAVSALAQFACLCSQMRLCRLLQARQKEQTSSDTVATSVSPSDLADVLSAVNGFQQNCAAKGWCRAPSSSKAVSGPLQMCSRKMAVEFIDRFHKQKREKISEVLDEEMWRASEVPSVVQRMVDRSVEEGRLLVVVEALEEAAASDTLLLRGEEYRVVGSAVVVLRCLADYAECLRTLPSFAGDILLRIVEILKSFNSRSCQLILGAGALQLVGLKTISVRNLALSSRSLQLVIEVVSLLREEVEGMLADDQAHLARHFTQVISDYRDHVNEITAKLVSVIDHNIVTSLEGWKIKGSIPSESFSAICRNLLKFHNGMSGIMPDRQIAELFSTVHSHFRQHLKLKVAHSGVSPHDSLTWGIVSQDYNFYTNSVRSMSACREMQFESLNEVVFS